MALTCKRLGVTSKNEEVVLYSLSNDNGFTMEFLNLGARWISGICPSKLGPIDVVFGLDSIASYEHDPHHLGGILGRCANRIANASFTLEGTTYSLAKNDYHGSDSIHSGPNYYDTRIWRATNDEATNSLTFHLDSPDGDQGFPGNLELQVTYTLTEDNTVKLSYDAICDQTTVFNPTNHVYFNLMGQDVFSLEGHSLWIDSTLMTETNNNLPTGAIIDITETDYDFTKPKPLEQFLDDNWCLSTDLSKPAAICSCETSGLKLEFFTEFPGVQVYTGNYLDRRFYNKHGKQYCGHSAFCLESQYYVNAINIPSFPQPILPANEKFHKETWYRFAKC